MNRKYPYTIDKNLAITINVCQCLYRYALNENEHLSAWPEYVSRRGKRDLKSEKMKIELAYMLLRAFCWSFKNIRPLVKFLTELLRVQLLETSFR